MQELKGKTAVITGGASGIGFATAAALARNGVKIVLADIEAPALDEAVASLKQNGTEAIGIVTDVGRKDAVETLADQAWSRFGAVHIVFNNAGIAVFGATQDMKHSDWEWTMRVNLWGPIHGVEAFVPRMIAQKQGGHILFTASFAGLVGNRGLGPYSVSKAAVVSLAECLQKDLRAHDIGVSVLCPMHVTTRINDSHRNRPPEFGGPGERQVFDEEEAGSVVGRVLAVEPVADLVVDAIKRNDLYILTHKETAEYVTRRFDRIRNAATRAL